ncbi:MAG: hypothetical protein JKY53_10765 [Flavobacteriales bacterium]|nr:hypothetical protein [Flavobacteriales bacterium]
MTENELRNIVFEKVKDLAIKGVLIGKEVPVPYKQIYIPGTSSNLEVWCFKQDIVFYHKLFDKSIGYRDAKIISGEESLVNIILEKDNVQNTKDVGLPLLIIETKRTQPSSHEIMIYSQKAEQIKSIFPYAKYIFLVFDYVSARTYRHGVNFDAIFEMPDVYDEKYIKNLRKLILKLFKEADADLVNLQTTAIRKNQKTHYKI